MPERVEPSSLCECGFEVSVRHIEFKMWGIFCWVNLQSGSHYEGIWEGYLLQPRALRVRASILKGCDEVVSQRMGGPK